MPIDHQSSAGDGLIKADIMRLHEEGHGVRGVIFSAADRQATDWKSGQPLKWEDGNPVKEYVLNIAAAGGKGMFALRDPDTGKPLKDSSGQTMLEERTVTDTDVCVIASGKGSYQLFKLCHEEKVNEGDEIRITRGRKSGTNVEYEVEVLSRNNPLRRFDPNAPAPSGIDHGADERQEELSPF